MRFCRTTLVCIYALGVSLCGVPSKTHAQTPETIEKEFQIIPKAGHSHDLAFRLLPSEEEQEQGNAVPVLLRMVYEQKHFMKELYPRLHEFAAMDSNDLRWKDFYFNRFAEQIIRAGSMAYADWEYPIRSERPYVILLPDIQSQRQLTGFGMTAWIRQQLSQGETEKALQGIKAQLACGRHCAATPVLVCHLVGMAIANMGFDNLELAIQRSDCPNMYWALAALPPTLHDLGPMVRWELWATPTRLNEPLPAIGSADWIPIANRFVELYSESSNTRYTPQEGETLQKRMDFLATRELSSTLGFSGDEVQQMTKEERIMRWIYLHYLEFRSQIEPLAYQSPKQIVTVKRSIEDANERLLSETGAKASPYPIAIPQAILACRLFERRAKFIQTIEAIRDYTSRNQGALPLKLDDLHLPAPNDPFTEQPFLYELNGKTARLSQTVVDGFLGAVLDYELSTR